MEAVPLRLPSSDLPPQNVWRVDQPVSQASPARTEAILEQGKEALPVRIKIVQDDLETGWDDGALGFDEHSFWFSGLATSFRIGAPDILPGAYLLSRHQAVTSGEARQQGFPLRHPLRTVWIRVSILTMEGRNREADEERLIREVQRLRSLTTGPIESQYPPLAPRPGTYRTATGRKKWMVLVGSLGLAGTLSSFLLTAFHHRLLGSVVQLLGTTFFFVSLMLSEGGNDAKLRRLAKEEAGS